MGIQKRVLVVDDDASIRELLSTALEEDGYEVVPAANGQDALAVCERWRPDVIVLDLMMPVMTGFEVLSAMRVNERWAKIPVIVLTGTGGYSADHLGVAAALEKPFDIHQVKAAVEVALGAKQAPPQGRKPKR